MLMDNFNFPHLKVIFPTAPQRPYTPLGGEVSKNVTPNTSLKKSKIKFDIVILAKQCMV